MLAYRDPNPQKKCNYVKNQLSESQNSTFFKKRTQLGRWVHYPIEVFLIALFFHFEITLLCPAEKIRSRKDCP